jgi:hypothetical protein
MKYLLAAPLLAGLVACAGIRDQGLPTAGKAILGVNAFYTAVCAEPLPQHQDVCEDAHPHLNSVVEFYNEINEAVGE